MTCIKTTPANNHPPNCTHLTNPYFDPLRIGHCPGPRCLPCLDPGVRKRAILAREASRSFIERTQSRGCLFSRHQVCTTRNVTFANECEFHRMKCLCQTGHEDCERHRYRNAHLDYYGACAGQ